MVLNAERARNLRKPRRYDNTSIFLAHMVCSLLERLLEPFGFGKMLSTPTRYPNATIYDE